MEIKWTCKEVIIFRCTWFICNSLYYAHSLKHMANTLYGSQASMKCTPHAYIWKTFKLSTKTSLQWGNPQGPKPTRLQDEWILWPWQLLSWELCDFSLVLAFIPWPIGMWSLGVGKSCNSLYVLSSLILIEIMGWYLIYWWNETISFWPWWYHLIDYKCIMPD